MSFHVLGHVQSGSKSRGPARMVLFCLAARANDDWEAWPSVQRLADEAGISTRTVYRCIDQLVALGELEVLSGGGGRGVRNRYRICRPELSLVPVDGPVDGPVDEPVDGKRTMTDSQRTMTRGTRNGDSCGTQKDKKDNEYTARDDSKKDVSVSPFHSCDNGWIHNEDGTVAVCSCNR